MVDGVSLLLVYIPDSDLNDITPVPLNPCCFLSMLPRDFLGNREGPILCGRCCMLG